MGENVKDLRKHFAQKLATSASADNAADVITVAGDCLDEVGPLILKKWKKVKEDQIVIKR